ncbi:MAG: hypothetical protein S4CHLAM45_08010 [Chlamydiales bacterium]|nr:hypothetical protein [Chlamydiales bacterium]MCH9619989.1 hypothetical protein [Chlamydiales bacterium]MCH9622907.1 hypothetical protein [Chlamydiales bacterium]
MKKVDWTKLLGWKEDQLNEMRFSGFTFLRDGRYKQAITFFEALVLLNPNNVFDRQTLGALYLQINKNEKALHHFDKALALAGKDETTLLNKTKALVMLGRRKEAIEIAKLLQKSADPYIAGDAQALIMAHS